LVKDVLPYIEVWTAVMIFVWMAWFYHTRRFIKKHPEIYEADTKKANKKKLMEREELQRQYDNKALLLPAIWLIWTAGVAAVVVPRKQVWCLLAISLVLFSVLLIVGWKRKPKK